MFVSSARSLAASAWKEVTIEPAILLYVMSGGIAYGAGQQTKLLLWKVINLLLLLMMLTGACIVPVRYRIVCCTSCILKHFFFPGLQCHQGLQLNSVRQPQ